MTFKSLAECAEYSLTHSGECKSFDCNFTIKEDGVSYEVYEVSIANCDLLFYSEKGTLNYVIDNYGGKAVPELFNINK